MNTPARRKHGTVLGAIKTKPLRVGLPARLDSPCARRLSVPRPGRRNGHSNRTKKLALLNKQGQRVIFCLHPSSRLKNGETALSRTKKHHCSSGPAILQNLTHITFNRNRMSHQTLMHPSHGRRHPVALDIGAKLAVELSRRTAQYSKLSGTSIVSGARYSGIGNGPFSGAC